MRWNVDPVRMRKIKKLIFTGSIHSIRTREYNHHSNCCAMDSILFALILLCSLQVDCQTYPYVSLSMGAGLPNHSYVDLGTVGTDFSTSVWCHTDLETCCRNEDGLHRGRLFFPNGVALQTNEDIYGKPQRVELRRANSATSPTGIYRCKIPTNASHDATDISVRATVYVGLYTSEGNFFGRSIRKNIWILGDQFSIKKTFMNF